MTQAAFELGTSEMEAVAKLWRATRREVVCRFAGASMSPALPPGAEVRLDCGAAGGAGDIIAFLERGHVVVHRVVALSSARGWILTRGDARLLPDAPIRRAEDVIGRVTAVREGEAFVPPAPPRAGSLQRAVLGPLLLALRVHARAGLALVDAAVHTRRLALAALTPWRRWISGRVRAAR